MRKTKWLSVITACLVITGLLVSFVAAACAPKTPAAGGGTPTADCSPVEAKLAAEQQKSAALDKQVKDLQGKLAASQKPVSVQEWQPASWAGAGMQYDSLVYLCKLITNMTEGRIIATPTASGAICPVEEQLDAVSMGTTPAMDTFPGYFAGKVPVTAWEGEGFGLIPTVQEMWDVWENYDGGRIMDIFRQEYDKVNVHLVGHHYRIQKVCIASKIPIKTAADIKGVMFRASDYTADVLKLLGAGVMWAPGSEIYTLLATGAIEAISWGSPPDLLASGINEVTKYWLKYPYIVNPGSDAFFVNNNAWQSLPDDLKVQVEAALQAASFLNVCSNDQLIEAAWKKAIDEGVVPIEWSQEDANKYYEATKEVIPRYRVDAATTEIENLVTKWMVEKGYWTQ